MVNNIGYTFNVQGRYGEGLSRKVSSAATPKSTRFDVENLLAAAGTEKARLSWNKPLSNALTGYQITVNPGNRILDINDPALDRYVIDALSNNVEYNFKDRKSVV